MGRFLGSLFHNVKPQKEEKAITEFHKMPLAKFAALVGKASLTNAQRTANAIATADCYSWQIANPQFLHTAENKRLIDHWLTTQGITNPTFPDYQAAYDHYKDSELLDLDAAELARDNSGPRSYTGFFTKETFDSVAGLIAQERVAALAQLSKLSDEEKALERHPPEEVLALLKLAERETQNEVNRSEIQDNADAWLLLHPEFKDGTRNGKLMTSQLRANGVTGTITIADFEKASQQLRASELLTLSKAELNKQHAKEIKQLATEAAASVFDTTTEAEAWELPLDELRRRANGNFSGSGV